jgi:hypothetical protein
MFIDVIPSGKFMVVKLEVPRKERWSILFSEGGKTIEVSPEAPENASLAIRVTPFGSITSPAQLLAAVIVVPVRVKEPPPGQL